LDITEETMKKIFAIAVVATLTAPAAFAQSKLAPVVDPIITAPAPVAAPRPIVDWTGPYAGATLGFTRTRWSGLEEDPDPDVTDQVRRFFREGQFGIAGHLGYNADMGDWVVGGEVALAPGFNQSVGDRDVRWGAAARVKAGPKLGARGDTWAFGTLGVAHARHRSTVTDDSRSSNGWMFGVGVSHLVQDNMFVTGEIGQTRFRGDNDVRSTGVALGVSFRF
jgi:outer membrane immunogenic protein